MCTRMHPVNLAAPLLLTLLMVMLATASRPAAAAEVCQGFDRLHTVKTLGGPHSMAPGGMETESDLAAYFAAHADEIRAVLAGQGLGEEVAQALLAAVRQGTGITERELRRGERLDWMAYQKNGEVVTIDDVCLDLSRAAPTFEIAVPLVTATATPQPDCSIEVTADCQPGGTGTFRVRTAPGARVTLEGPGGTRKIIEGGSTSWTGPIEQPYRADYSFTVSNEAAAFENVTSYTFLLPKACGNLAFLGRTEEQRSLPPVTCRQQRTLSQPVCPVHPASCTIDLDAAKVRRGKEVGYRVTGTWTGLELELLRDGKAVSEPALTGEQGTLRLPERGTYTVVGTATNEVGETHTCRASVDVVGTDWIARAFGAYLVPRDGEVKGAVSPGGCPCAADTRYGYDSGFGFGLSVERLLSERIGLELRGLFARLDDDFGIEANGVGVSASGTPDYWDVSLGLNVHLLPDRRLDWYAGPFVGYAAVEGETYLVVDRSLEYDAHGALTWGAQTGLDWPFGDGPWALHAGARYTRYEADIDHRYTDPDGLVRSQPRSLGLDPLTLELGLAYRF